MTYKCECFGCKNVDNIDRLYGYYYGCYKVYEDVVEQLKKYGIKPGSIGDDNINGLLARYECTMQDWGCLLDWAESALKKCEKDTQSALKKCNYGESAIIKKKLDVALETLKQIQMEHRYDLAEDALKQIEDIK